MTRLAWRGTSADSLGIHFVREGERTHARSLRHMRRVSRVMLTKAIAYSPVDYKGKTRGSEPLHELERSHRLAEEAGDRRRIEARIEVGGMVGDVDVDLYAMWIHDGIGWDQRGPATVAKGPKAGPFWLERAMQEHLDDFEPLLDELMGALFG